MPSKQKTLSQFFSEFDNLLFTGRNFNGDLLAIGVTSNNAESAGAHGWGGGRPGCLGVIRRELAKLIGCDLPDFSGVACGFPSAVQV